MKKLIFFLFISTCLHSQTVLGKWQDYFSYFHIIDIIELENELICATENGLFTYDKTTSELSKISKATGLHGVKVSAIGYNELYQYLFIAYQNGAFDIITPNGIEYFVDIPIDTDFQGDKSVNHIYSEGDKAVFSMNFGVVVFDLPNLEFDETAYFRMGTDYIVVNESVILNNEVIALSNNGIYTHPIDDFIPNFNGWSHYFPGTAFLQAERVGNTALAATSSALYQTTDAINYTPMSTNGTIIDLNNGQNCFSVIYPSQISTYNTALQFTGSHPFSTALTTGICATNGVFGGTQYNGIINQSTLEEIAPDGPYSNNSYKITLFEDQIYIAPGGRNVSNFYLYLNNTDGFYHYINGHWVHIPYSEIGQRNVTELAVNPLNIAEVFASTYSANGIVVTENDMFQTLYNSSNSSFIGNTSLGIVSISNIFDDEGYYYGIESYSQNGIMNNLNIKSPAGNWLNIPLALPGTSTSHLMLDHKGWMWIGSPRTGGGLLAYDFNQTPMNTGDDQYYLLSSGEGLGNLPEEEAVVCVTQDKSNIIWIGTRRGLRIKRNANNELEAGNLDTEMIVIEQDGIPEEFLKDVLIYDIAVDEGNNKWIATGGGVFYVSENGKTTRLFLNEDNSPLPSNTITDIEIDDTTGKVYFASGNGLVSYQGDFVTVGDEFGEVIVYPNPVRPGFNGNIVIKGLAKNAKVKITDINGNVVHQGIAKGGALEWDQTNLQGNRVASGIYLALMLNQDNLITKTTKFAIIR